jgi:hypothetical protein
MGIGKDETTDERKEIEVLCQRNREAFLRMDFLLGVDRPLETLSTGDILCLIGLEFEEMDRNLAELNEMLTSDGRTGSSS